MEENSQLFAKMSSTPASTTPSMAVAQMQRHLYLSSEPGLTKRCANLSAARGIASPGCDLLLKVTLSLSFLTRVLCMKMLYYLSLYSRKALLASVRYHTPCAVRKLP